MGIKCNGGLILVKLRKLKGNSYELSGSPDELARFKRELATHIQHHHMMFPRF